MTDAPLRETLLLLTGMAAFSAPLLWATFDWGDSKAQASARMGEKSSPQQTIRCDIEVQGAHPLEWIELSRQSDGAVIGRWEGPLTFGEIEGELLPGMNRLIVSAKWAADAPRSAIYLELWPDGFPATGKSFWGQDQLQQTWEVSLNE